MQRIDLTAAPDQRMSVVLDGRRVTLRFWFNVSDQLWYFDMALDDQPVMYGRRIVTGRNLLSRVGLGGRLFAYVYAGGDGQPGLEDFASGAAALFYVPEAELKTALAA